MHEPQGSNHFNSGDLILEDLDLDQPNYATTQYENELMLAQQKIDSLPNQIELVSFQ